jgi:glycosyltransferase involved in cell wall biosynthesis
MKSVVIRGPLLSISGYGVHARQVYRWLKTQNIDVTAQITPWGNTTFMVNPEADETVKSIMADSNAAKKEFDISLQIQLPDEWDSSLAKTNVGITAAVETDRCNPAWITNCNSMDRVIVPSRFTEGVLKGTGNISKPVSVVSEAYDEGILGSNVLDLDLSTSFNFLIVSQLTSIEPSTDRKNIFNTIKWLCEAFSDDKDVGIIIKTNLGRATDIDRMNTRNTLLKMLKEIRRGPFPRIHFIHGDMSTEEIGSLYRNPKIKSLVSLTRGEGFGLPLLEAACNNLPVIATNWSGHLDFMGMGKYVTVDYSLKEIPDSRVDGRIFVKGLRWAEPSEEDFKRRIKKFRNSSDVPRQWADDLGNKVRERFSTESVNKQYDRVLGDLF